MKKIIIFLMCVFLLAGCSTGTKEQVTQDKPEQETEIDNNDNEAVDEHDENGETVSEEETDISSEGKAVIAETVLAEKDGIKVTAAGIEYQEDEPVLAVHIENGADYNITVEALDVSVNGMMYDPMYSYDVEAGQNADTYMDFSAIEDFGAEDIAYAEFRIHIFNDVWETVLETDLLRLDTSIADTYVQNYDDSGEVVYDANDIRIISKGLDTEDSFLGPGVRFYLENNSNNYIYVDVLKTTVGGNEVDALFYSELTPSKKALSLLNVQYTDMEENNLTELKDVEVVFQIFNKIDEQELFKTEPLKITLP